MTISAKMIEHSSAPHGGEIKSLLLRYPRFVHAEFMTHRVFSRNASSSRAIPVERLIEDVIRDTAMPIHWGKNQAGMQAREEHNAEIDLETRQINRIGGASIPRIEAYNRTDAWNEARDRAIEVARAFNAAGYHKQIVNRILEPFSHINVLVTSTEWDNFFELRDHADAQPEIQVLAKAIKAEFSSSQPRLLQPGQWHLPFVKDDERAFLTLAEAIMVSVARCARTSYLTHEGKPPQITQDIQLYERLVGARPLHASPAEHQATPDVFVKGDVWSDVRPRQDRWQQLELHGNFVGWVQNRKILEATVL